MSSFSDYIAYFETIARSHTSIGHTDGKKHFSRVEITEMIEGIKTNIYFPFLALEGYEFSYRDNRSDNFLKDRTGAFWLVDQCSDPGNYDRIHEIYGQMESIADEIFRKIRADYLALAAVAKDFDINSLEVQAVGPVGDNYYGLRITFSLTTNLSMVVDEDKWS